MPLPDANPNRTAALPFAMKGTLTPAIAAPPPAMDYTAILKPILSYDLRISDEANIREVLRSGTAAAARIKDPAARDFALWYKYRNSPAISGNAEDIEQFRLVPSRLAGAGRAAREGGDGSLPDRCRAPTRSKPFSAIRRR